MVHFLVCKALKDSVKFCRSGTGVPDPGSPGKRSMACVRECWLRLGLCSGYSAGVGTKISSGSFFRFLSSPPVGMYLESLPPTAWRVLYNGTVLLAIVGAYSGNLNNMRKLRNRTSKYNSPIYGATLKKPPKITGRSYSVNSMQ